MFAQPAPPPGRTTHTPDQMWAFELSDVGLLGSGAHGVVRAARHVETGDLVAVKVMPASVLAAIAKELIAQAKMHHPNIVQLHTTQVDLDKRRVYMVMELCRGGELFDRIAECGRLDEPTAQCYLVQMARAVAHCHAHNVYHRDLKPENILLDEYDQVKIADFGLAALAHQVREDASFLQHTKCGSLMYAAPEVLVSTEQTGYDAAKADVWSLGIILYSMLSGALPFRMAVASKCPRYAIVQQRGVRILCEANAFSPDATELLCAMLDPDPSKRISAKEILTSTWVSPAVAETGLALGELGSVKWSVVLGDKTGEVELPDAVSTAAHAAGEAAVKAAQQMQASRSRCASVDENAAAILAAEEVERDNAAKEAAARVAMSRMAATSAAASAAAAPVVGAAGDKKRTVEVGGDNGTSSSSKRRALSATGASVDVVAAPSSQQPSAAAPSSSPGSGSGGFFKHPAFDEVEEEIPGGVNGMLVRSLGWVQLPEEKERMVGDVATALDALGVKYQVVKGELSDVVWVGQPSEIDTDGAPDISSLHSPSGGVSRQNTTESTTSMAMSERTAHVLAGAAGHLGGGAGSSTGSLGGAACAMSSAAMSVDGGLSPQGGVPRRMSIESSAGSEIGGAMGGAMGAGGEPSPGAYSQGRLCVRLRIQPGPAGPGSSNLHITRHTGDVLQFHSFYRDVRNQLAGRNGWVNKSGRYEHTVVDDPS